MSLLEIWLLVLLAFSSGDQCNIGTPIPDWDDYWPRHELVDYYELRFNTEESMQIIHLFILDNDDQVLFIYNPADMPHGQCAVVLPDEWRYIEGEISLLPVTQEAA